MDCSEVREIIDAYALGASDPEDAARIEEHVADCVRCWDELGKAQRTAALLALSVPMMDVPQGLEGRVMAAARRDVESAPAEASRPPLLQRLRLSWATAAAGLGVASLAALAFAGMLQAQVDDLRDENRRIEAQARGTTQVFVDQLGDMSETVENQEALLASVVSRSEPGVELTPSGQADASVWYTWDPGGGDGWVVCDDLDNPPEGMVYLVWFKHDTESVPAAAFAPEDGKCLLAVDASSGAPAPTGVGLSLEDPEAIPDGPDRWLAYASFPTGN